MGRESRATEGPQNQCRAVFEFVEQFLVVSLACAFKSVGGYPGALRGAHMSRKTKPRVSKIGAASSVA
jgi:hypothetical protein